MVPMWLHPLHPPWFMEGWFVWTGGEGWLKSNKITKSGQNRPKNHHFSIQKLPPRDPCRDATEHLTEALGSLDHPPGSTTTSSWSGSALLAASPAQFWSEFRVKEGIRGKSWQWKCWFTQNKHRKFGKIWEIRKSEKLERFLTVSCQGTPATRTPSAGPISTAAVPAVGIKVAIPVVLSWDPQKISWFFFRPVQDYSSFLDYIIDESGWIHKIFQPSSLTREWLKLAGTWPLPTPLRDSTDQKK